MPARKVLVAEDDPQLLQSLSIRLRSAGYEVITASDAYQAVAQARKLWPDLLLLDVGMPGGDGFSVQERVWRMVHMRRTPVVYITGDKSHKLGDVAHRLGAVAVLHKPFETDVLLGTIAAVLAEDPVLTCLTRGRH